MAKDRDEPGVIPAPPGYKLVRVWQGDLKEDGGYEEGCVGEYPVLAFVYDHYGSDQRMQPVTYEAKGNAHEVLVLPDGRAVMPDNCDYPNVDAFLAEAHARLRKGCEISQHCLRRREDCHQALTKWSDKYGKVATRAFVSRITGKSRWEDLTPRDHAKLLRTPELTVDGCSVVSKNSVAAN